MKTICQVTFSEYPNDQRIRRYVSALIETGYRVIVLCIRDEHNKESEYGEKLIIKRLGVSKKRGSYSSRTLEYASFFFKSVFYTTLFFFKYRIRVFHVNTFPDFAAFTPAIPKLFGAKILLDLHELTPEAMMMRENYNEDKFIIKFLKFIEKMSILISDELITIHDIAGEILSERNKRKFTYIINGIDENEFTKLKKLPNQYFDIIYIGTINPNLNLGLVIDALELLRKQVSAEEFDKIRFLIYGKGPELDNILEKAKQKGLEKKVIYKGVVSYKKMLEELRYASVTIYPPKRNIYTEICYPIKLTEFINLNIPVIATKYRTLNYFYPDDCIFYINPENLQEVVNKIMLVYRNPGEVKIKTNNALEAYKKVSWKNVMKKRYLDLIEKMCA